MEDFNFNAGDCFPVFSVKLKSFMYIFFVSYFRNVPFAEVIKTVLFLFSHVFLQVLGFAFHLRPGMHLCG